MKNKRILKFALGLLPVIPAISFSALPAYAKTEEEILSGEIGIEGEVSPGQSDSDRTEERIDSEDLNSGEGDSGDINSGDDFREVRSVENSGDYISDEKNSEERSGEDSSQLPPQPFFVPGDSSTDTERTLIGWVETDGDWYYYNQDGSFLIGFQQVGSKRYFFSEEGIMQTGWIDLDGEQKYFRENGALATGWQGADGYWYYFDESGNAKTGWILSGTNWYYLDEYGHMLTDWQKIGAVWYCFKSDGRMRTGWYKEGEEYYYFAQSGRVTTGWLLDNDLWYYFSPAGKMCTGWKCLNNKWYFFGVTGEMEEDCWIGGYYVGKNGVWDPTADKTAVRRVKLAVKNILQKPELPNGCEVTSLAIALNYLGYDVSKTDLSDNYLPKGSVGKVMPDVAFIGNPRSANGWFCYSQVITRTAKSYLYSVGGKEKVMDLTGSSFEDLCLELVDGNPIIVWTTLSMTSPVSTGYWDSAGKYPKYINLHCVVLTGYDLDKGVVYIANPLRGNVSYSLSSFKSVYAKMGKQAVVIRSK